MSCTRRTAVTALVASIALLATLPAPCLCLPEAPAVEHDCCAPAPGLLPEGGSCCVAPATSPETLAAKPQPPAVAASKAAAAFVTLDAATRVETAAPPPAVSLSPPLTVRRL